MKDNFDMVEDIVVTMLASCLLLITYILFAESTTLGIFYSFTAGFASLFCLYVAELQNMIDRRMHEMLIFGILYLISLLTVVGFVIRSESVSFVVHFFFVAALLVLMYTPELVRKRNSKDKVAVRLRFRQVDEMLKRLSNE